MKIFCRERHVNLWKNDRLATFRKIEYLTFRSFQSRWLCSKFQKFNYTIILYRTYRINIYTVLGQFTYALLIYIFITLYPFCRKFLFIIDERFDTVKMTNVTSDNSILFTTRFLCTYMPVSYGASALSYCPYNCTIFRNLNACIRKVRCRTK